MGMFDSLDHSKIYCYNCFIKGEIVTLNVDESKEFCISCLKKHGRSQWRVQFDVESDEMKVFRGMVLGNKSQSNVSKDYYKTQKENKTGWCSNESIMKKNSSHFNSIRQKNAASRGLKTKAVQTQLERGLHPSQNLELQARKILLMQLKRAGMDIKLEDISSKDNYQSFIKMVPLTIDGSIVNYENSHEYDNRCGSIGLLGYNKYDKHKYALNAGKSLNLGEEIRKFWKIISQPEKQDINDDYGRWWHIANDYENFEIVIICVYVSESEAILLNAK